MAQHKTDEQMIRETRNTARFFVETRHISWVLLLSTIAWGIYGYLNMPQRKDPDIPVRVAVALTAWPGAGAERVEQLVTKKVEERIGEKKLNRCRKNNSPVFGFMFPAWVNLNKQDLSSKN